MVPLGLQERVSKLFHDLRLLSFCGRVPIKHFPWDFLHQKEGQLTALAWLSLLPR
jgi:hypothetical protein